MKQTSKAIVTLTLLFLPAVAFAATNLQEVLLIIGLLIGRMVPIAVALALLAFIWGLAMYLFNFGEGKDDKQKQGRSLMVWGVIALFLIVSIAGIVALLQATFGIASGNLTPPTIDPKLFKP